MRILVLFAHPVETSFASSLHAKVVEVLRATGHKVDDCDLYAEGFDPVMSRQDRIDYHNVAVNRRKVAPYVDRLLAGLGKAQIGHLSIGWDAGNGAAGEIMRRLTQRLPGHHLLLNETIDGNFPAHHPDPTEPENLRQLQDLVARHRLDLHRGRRQGAAHRAVPERGGHVQDAAVGRRHRLALG